MPDKKTKTETSSQVLTDTTTKKPTAKKLKAKLSPFSWWGPTPEAKVIGFSGTRVGMTEYQMELVENALKILKPERVHHGDCMGSDADFDKIANELNIPITIHPPERDTLRAFCKSDEILKPKPYLDRNRDIVDNCDTLIATPQTVKPVKRGSGTWHAIRYAKKQKKNIIIVYPTLDSGVEVSYI